MISPFSNKVSIILFGICAVVFSSEAEDFGNPKRVPWIGSRIEGSPDPPRPYVTEEVFKDIRIDNGVEMIAAGGRFFVMERDGKIWSFPDRPDAKEAELFADLAEIDPETKNAYGMAFHPNWRENRQIFLAYTHDRWLDEGTKIARFQLSQTDPPKLDPDSREVILTWPSGGHNGANLRFGPDGMLYISTGDGRPPAPPDSLDTGQDNSDLLAAILRIDVDGADPGKKYRVPADNPFVGLENVRPEIWAFGFRNPWKMSFDGQGRLWVGDVGWELWEMIHLVEKGGNYGWSAMEASQPIKPELASDLAPISPPAVAHPHTEAASITGGYAYRGEKFPELRGAYIYGDYETGKIWALWYEGGKIARHEEIADTPHRISTFGESEDGELFYIHYTQPSTFHRLVPNPRAGKPSEFPRKLSQTGLFFETAAQQPSPGVYEFEIAEPMWQDGTVSRRFIALPGASRIEAKIQRRDTGEIRKIDIHWPENAVLARTVSLPEPAERKIETQVLHFDGEAWNGYSYRWNEAGTDAELVGAEGAEVTIPATEESEELRYRIHSRAECARCHNMWNDHTLAFQPWQLEAFPAFGNELPVRETALHLELADPYFFGKNSDGRLVSSRDRGSLDKRARSWLHANCAHCHRRHGGGSAPLEVNFERALSESATLFEKPTRGEFGLTDPRIIVPGEPWRSLLVYRIATTGSGHMPLIGARQVDVEGLKLMWDWIENLPHEEPEKAGEFTKSEVDSPSDALRKLHAMNFGRELSAEDEKQARELALNSPDANIRALFERFLPPDQRPETVGSFVDVSTLLKLEGDPERGAEILSLQGKWAACYACHVIDGAGNDLGPELSNIGSRMTRKQILESILDPSKTVAPEYQAWLVETRDGKSHTGFILGRQDGTLTMKLATGQVVELARSEIKRQKLLATSLMPEGLMQSLTAQEAADVVSWLSSLK